jgi:hypothetical protein
MQPSLPPNLSLARFDRRSLSLSLALALALALALSISLDHSIARSRSRFAHRPPARSLATRGLSELSLSGLSLSPSCLSLFLCSRFSHRTKNGSLLSPSLKLHLPARHTQKAHVCVLACVRSRANAGTRKHRPVRRATASMCGEY